MSQYLTCGFGAVEVRIWGWQEAGISAFVAFAEADARGYAGAFAAVSRLIRSCSKASADVGQTLVHRVPSGPVV